MLNLMFLFSLTPYLVFIQAGYIQEMLSGGILMHIDRLNAECRGKSVPHQGYFYGVKIISATTIFIRNYTLIVKESGIKNLRLNITIDRCRSRENLDTCEEYFKQPNIDYCKVTDPSNIITSRNSMAFPLKPPAKCPINKGIYQAYNFTFDLSPFIFFKLDNWYWKAKSEVFTPDQNRLIYCSHLDVYFTNTKIKKN